MIRAVLDTNVLVSGLIVKFGPSARIIDALREGQFLLVTSKTLFREFLQVIRYPRIWKKYKLSENEVKLYLQALKFKSEMVFPAKIPQIILEDPSDNVFLATAVEGKSDFIVSGDFHLLKLGEYKKIKIVSPTKFVKILEREQKKK